MGDAADDLTDDGFLNIWENDMEDEVVEVRDVKCTVETDKALLCIVDGEEEWIPKSQVHDDSEVYKKDDAGTLVVSSWFAKKKGWE